MTVWRLLILVAILPALLMAGCGEPETGGESTRVRLVSPAGKSVTVEVDVAADDTARQRGLQGRSSLAMHEGMLFVFPDERVRVFWMQDVLIPLDIFFFDCEGNMHNMDSLSLCKRGGQGSQYSCPTSRSSGPTMFVLEVPAGFITANQITEQWKLLRDPPSPDISP
jgi:uncharacterized membrane protein (UPF0127 family)